MPKRPDKVQLDLVTVGMCSTEESGAATRLNWLTPPVGNVVSSFLSNTLIPRNVENGVDVRVSFGQPWTCASHPLCLIKDGTRKKAENGVETRVSSGMRKNSEKGRADFVSKGRLYQYEKLCLVRRSFGIPNKDVSEEGCRQIDGIPIQSENGVEDLTTDGMFQKVAKGVGSFDKRGMSKNRENGVPSRKLRDSYFLLAALAFSGENLSMMIAALRDSPQGA